MRIALLASPRCGNNWVRRVLSHVLETPHFAAHRMEEFPADLPADCIINIHEVKREPVLDYLSRNEFNAIVVLARHPLDIFVSVLQFARNDPSVHRWLDGRCEIPPNAQSLAPNDPQFVDFMLGPGATALLSVSLSWWNDPIVSASVRYEDLVAEPVMALSQLCRKLGRDNHDSVREACEKYSVAYFSQFNSHGWIGKAETYQKFFSRSVCEKVYKQHKVYFDTIGYGIRPNRFLIKAKGNHNYFASLP